MGRSAFAKNKMIRGFLMDVVYRYDPFEAITRQNLADTDEAVAYLVRGHNRYCDILLGR